MEPDDAIRESLRLVLEDEGYPISEAKTWRDALGFQRADTSSYIILLDVSLVTPQDLRLLRRLLGGMTQVGRHALVLLSTNPHLILAAVPDLAREVPIVPKPFDIDDLTNIVATAARRLSVVSVVPPQL